MVSNVVFPFLVFLTMGIWGVLHSWLSALRTKQVAGRIFGKKYDRYYRLVFIMIAIATLLPILAMVIFLPSRVFWIIPAPWRYLTIGFQLLAGIGLVFTVLKTDAMTFLGIRQFLEPDRNHENNLVIKGFYKFTRHPMYLFSLILMWLVPYMTDLLLAWMIASTLYIIIGSIPEERKLIAKFGNEYRLYRQAVPWLIPGTKFRKH